MKITAIIALLLVALVCVDALKWVVEKQRDGDVVRKLKVTKGQHTIDVRASEVDKSEKTTNAIQFKFSTNWVPRYVMRYYSKDADSKEFTSARWSLWKIIEYAENTTNDSGFDPSQDEIVSHYRLYLRNFDNMDVSQTTENGVTVYHACTNLSPNDGVQHPDVELCARTVDKRAVLNNTNHHPNAIKWTISISNYPYKRTNTRLAMKIAFDSFGSVRTFAESGDATAQDLESTEDAFELSNQDGIKTAAAWTKSIDVTGCTSATGSVVRTVVREGQWSQDVDTDYPSSSDEDSISWQKTYRVSYFSFITDCRPTSVVWDPEMGVITEEDSSSLMIAPSILLLLALLFIALF